MERRFTNIVKAANNHAELETFLNAKSKKMSVLFIDLVGSTELKAKRRQIEWVSVLCRFHSVVSGCISKNKGKVLKYIGDEVMATFPDGVAGEGAMNAEHCIRQCEARLTELGTQYGAKYSADYGEGAEVKFFTKAP